MQDKLPEVVVIMVGSTLIILVLTSLIITALFINQKRKFRHKLEMSSLKTAYDHELLRTRLEIQSQTFETISRELHDNVGTLVSISLVHLRSLDSSEPGRVNEVSGLLNEAMDTLRDISKSLSPENIGRLGWQQAFLNELDRVGRSGLFKVRSAVIGQSVPIEANKQIILFRILQEALNNIVKHSEATEVSVRIVFSDNAFTVKLQDNGKGLPPSWEVSPNTGSGIRNMRSRAALLPATLAIGLGHAGGTCVEINCSIHDQ